MQVRKNNEETKPETGRGGDNSFECVVAKLVQRGHEDIGHHDLAFRES
jgi:hypothetical protein